MTRSKTKKAMESRKRFWADCCRCTMSYDSDRHADTPKRCICGEKLAWNDRNRLMSVEGKRECELA